jgi:hypothetical protein
MSNYQNRNELELIRNPFLNNVNIAISNNLINNDLKKLKTQE